MFYIWREAPGNYDSPAVDEDMEEDDLEGADSGVGGSLRPSSGRHSSLSHYSDGTVIQIPDGRYVNSGTEDADIGHMKTFC